MTLPSNSVIFINIAIIILILVAMIVGYMKGFLWQLVRTLGIFGLILFSWILAPGLSNLIQVFPEKYAPFKDTPLNSVFYDKINTLCWFVIVLIVGLILLAIIKPIFKVITEIPVLKQFNKVIGAILSLIPSLLIIVLFTYLLNTAIFTNGKDIINNSLLKYSDKAVDKIVVLLNDSFSENVAIQKMISDPLSLKEQDVQSIVDWLKRSHISSQEIYDFLMKYGIDTNLLNKLINPGE
ncbi:MAG: CvpA family protein [Erysipelotrichia bacterium]|nr:CvpA family protein [Erysipelotrichia bacterium]